MPGDLEIKIRVKINIEMSLWEAIKLRVAGGDFLKELIRQKLEKESNT